MTAKISYRDIPKEERKRLASIIREEPKFVLPFAILMGLAVAFSGYFSDFTDHIVKANFPNEGASGWLHCSVDIALLIPITAVIGFAFRPWFKREVERRWEESQIITDNAEAAPRRV